MKTIQIVTKSQANRMQVESLFVPVNGRTLSKAKYCGGKYKPGSFPKGREINVSENVHAVWSESRKDVEGPYSVLYCLTSN